LVPWWKGGNTGDFGPEARRWTRFWRALRNAGIEVTALRKHMLDDQTRAFFAQFLGE
jgi:hypothetical protein